jgi:hypothetical protein
LGYKLVNQFHLESFLGLNPQQPNESCLVPFLLFLFFIESEPI